MASEPASEALKRVLGQLYLTMRRNEDGVRSDLDTGFLHDYRVAVRRTRAALGQIKRVLPAADRAHFRAEFDWLGRATSPLRDLDVHLLALHEQCAAPPALEEALRRQRESERLRLVTALDSERYAALVRDWEGFLETPPGDDSEKEPRNAGRPIRDVAIERIRSVHRRAIARGRSLAAGSPPEELHRLRIACKKLRYLIEFFASVLDEGAVAKLVKALKRMQDHLGTLNDLDVQREALRGIAQQMRAAGPPAEADAPAVEARIAEGDARESEERERFLVAFRKFDTDKTREWLDRAIGADG